MNGWQTRYTIAISDAPSDAMRAALDVRRQRLDGWLAPAGVDAATECYKDLLATMAAATLDAEGEVRELRGFVEATEKLPLFALQGACRAFRDGVVGDGKWMPKPGQICIEARRRVVQLAKERQEIEAVLTADFKPAITNSARKDSEVAAAVLLVREMPINQRRRDVEAGFASQNDVDRQAMEQRPGEPLAAYQARMVSLAQEVASKPTPQIGAALRKRLLEQGAIRPTPLAPADADQGDDWREHP